VTGAKVKDGSLTGADIDASTLGTVPSATKATKADSAIKADSAGDSSTLQGKSAAAFVQGNGNLVSARRQLAVGEIGINVLSLPGIGTVTAACTAGPEYAISVNNTSGAEMDYVAQSGSDLAPNGGAVPSGSSLSFSENLDAQVWRAQVATRTATPTVASLTISFRRNAPSPCVVIAQATLGS
jgi:hypothetical protein